MKLKMTTPQLRFPKFENEADWSTKKLGDFCKIRTGKLDANAASSDGEYRFYTCAKDYLMIDTYAFDTEALLISGNGAGVGYVHYYKGKFNAYQRTYVLDGFKEGINFVQFQLETKLRKRIKLESKAGNIPYIVMDTLAGMRLSLPTLPEQRKIAEFLTAVDGRIGQLIQKKALLEDYKKGVMQQLFTQAIRFKDKVNGEAREGALGCDHGNDFPDWEEKKLGEVLTIGSGRDYKHLGEGDIPVYGSGGVMTYVDAALYEGESVGIGRKGTIDKPQFLEGAFWTVDTLFYTHSFKKVLPRFIFAVFQTINWKAHNEAGGVPSLSKRTIDQIPLSVPSMEEQTKIADFLSALDRKIESVATQITETQTFKRGLLQQMFV